MSREFLDPGLVLASGLAFISTILLLLTVPRPHVVRPLRAPRGFLLGGALSLAALLAAAVTGEVVGAVVAATFAGVICVLIRKGMPRLTEPGVLHTALAPIALISGTAWAYALATQSLPDWTPVLAAGACLALVMFGFTFATRLVEEAIYTHAEWRRPTRAPTAQPGAHMPKVSIHVPCYAEPPEVVLQTLQRLADLQYPNYEVIVCDNNTQDEALWLPLQRFCHLMNARAPDRFRFYHVSPLAGAKAGALNFCLERTAPDAELVAVVDADYLATPDFLIRLCPFFADPKLGFIQTPHDYRRDATPYQAMCYWEYMPPNKIGIAALNEYDCAYTIGTMCILRKDAITAAGGWAEWCLTEDSEISIRIRALGYEGLYFNETFGRGLIPETYADYKKQRFRWTAGPVQQVLAHWRLFMPTAWGGSPAMHGWVKLLELRRSLEPVVEGCGFLAVLAGLGVFLATTISGRAEPISLPPVFWFAAFLTAAAGLVRLWHQYRLAGCSAPHLILGAQIAGLSLIWVRAVAVAAALSGRPLKWRRTPKFATNSSVGRALYAALPETALAAAFAVAMQLPLRNAQALGPHAAWLMTSFFAAGTLAFLAGPLMAILAEARLHAIETGRLGDEVEEIVEPALPRAA